MKRTIVIVAFAITLMLAPAAQAGGLEPGSWSVGTEREGSGASAVAVYRLNITAGPDGSAFGLSYRLPPWPGHEELGGSPLKIQSVELMGPGDLRPAMPLLVAKPALRPKPGCRRSPPSFPERLWIELPAAASSVVEIRVQAGQPIWPDTRQDLTLTTFASENPPSPPVPLWTGAAPALGIRGVHIRLRESEWQDLKPLTTPDFVGSTDPPLRHMPVFLQVLRPSKPVGVDLGFWGRPSAVSLGSVTTDAAGHFRVPSKKLSQTGLFTVLARAKGSGRLTADWNCSPFFWLRAIRHRH